jgi:hypothetical protein
MEARGQAHHFIITTITEERNLSTWVWALPLACAKLGGRGGIVSPSLLLSIPIFSSILSYSVI